ncbi:DUF3137 domain-containing protein [Gallaecimonas sp. GXIMD4217]|uniref:DUF3137 domain-containing protein n=1 Tax=Gallaecimonas sp. GXIMD4217 TaxID=3131927 RepID=UPI00311AF1BF
MSQPQPVFASGWWSLLKGRPVKIQGDEAAFDFSAPWTRGFPDYYRQHISPLCDGFEQARQRAVSHYRRNLRIWALPAALATLATFLYLAAGTWPNASGFMDLLAPFLWSAGVAMASCYLIRRPVRHFHVRVGKEVFPVILAFLGRDFRFNSGQHHQASHYRPTGLLPAYDRVHYEDHIRGRYHGLDLDILELRLEKRRKDSKGRTTYSTVFDGLLVEVDAHKKFTGTTQIRQDHGALFNTLGKLFNGLERVKLEDPRFEDAFEVYGSDQVESRYLLTTATMERFLAIARRYNARLEACFYGGKLFIKLPTRRNYFQVGTNIYEPITFEADIEQLFAELQEFFDLIDTLKLTDKSAI